MEVGGAVEAWVHTGFGGVVEDRESRCVVIVGNRMGSLGIQTPMKVGDAAIHPSALLEIPTSSFRPGGGFGQL